MNPAAHIDPDNERQTIDRGDGPCECVLISVYLPVAIADQLAAHAISRGDSAITADPARVVGQPVADALVGRGYGRS